jgi:uncharacterized membrane protein YjfL (UPF0719 family)
MSFARVLIGLGEFALSLALVVLALWLTHRLFARLAAGLDEEKELKAGNVAAAILLAAVMIAPATIVLRTLTPVVHVFRVYMMGSDQQGISLGALVAYAAFYIVFVFALALVTLWLAIRLFDRLTPGVDEFAEIRRGNVAVALMMAGVILVVTLFMQEGIAALSRGLVPETSLGELKIMR